MYILINWRCFILLNLQTVTVGKFGRNLNLFFHRPKIFRSSWISLYNYKLKRERKRRNKYAKTLMYVTFMPKVSSIFANNYPFIIMNRQLHGQYWHLNLNCSWFLTQIQFDILSLGEVKTRQSSHWCKKKIFLFKHNLKFHVLILSHRFCHKRKPKAMLFAGLHIG